MAYVKQLNGKAVPSTDTNDLKIPEGIYIAAVCFMDEIRFYGAVNEDDLITIGKTLDPIVETIADAKSTIDNIGCRFLNDNLVTN